MAGLVLRWLTCLGGAGPQDQPGWQGFQGDGGFWFPERNTEPPGGGVEEKGQVLKGVSRAGVTLMRPSCRICFPFPGGALLRPAGCPGQRPPIPAVLSPQRRHWCVNPQLPLGRAVLHGSVPGRVGRGTMVAPGLAMHLLPEPGGAPRGTSQGSYLHSGPVWGSSGDTDTR